MASADAVWACDRLDEATGSVSWRSHGDPLDGLVQTILSQHTSDTNSERAFDSLRRRFPQGWDAVRMAERAAVVEAIRGGGLAQTKARTIQNALEAIHARTGETDLRVLETMSTEAAREWLVSLPGVGPKTAACVLMFCLGRPALPVDTHVFRVSHRLGLVDAAVGEAKAHRILEAQVPPERVYAFHVQMIRHGRRVCDARRPRCGECVLAERCRAAREGIPGAGKNKSG